MMMKNLVHLVYLLHLNIFSHSRKRDINRRIGRRILTTRKRVFRHADVCLCRVCIRCQFCMTCSLLMLVEDARGDHIEEAYSRAGFITTLSASFLLFTQSCYSECFYEFCACTEMVWMCVLYVSFGSKVKSQNLWVRCHG